MNISSNQAFKVIHIAKYDHDTRFTGNKCNVNSLQKLRKQNLELYLDYASNLYKQNSTINFFQIKKLGIPDLKLVYNRGVRGETLSASRNTKHLPLIKEYGIDTIIDLRTSDYTENFKNICEKLKFKYVHIPIDKSSEPDRSILDNLPVLFELLKKGRFYIACAQGKHRTDIALAINYVFNPAEKIPPSMSGHTNKNMVDMKDINTRLDSLYKALTPEDKIKFKWPVDYDETYLYKRRVLKTYSETRCSNC